MEKINILKEEINKLSTSNTFEKEQHLIFKGQNSFLISETKK
jgi:hypothetical protein